MAPDVEYTGLPHPIASPGLVSSMSERIDCVSPSSDGPVTDAPGLPVHVRARSLTHRVPYVPLE
ncbi:hypothetical protein GCM10010317_057930 [Streptomyces mirabilis]|nr:hypothetical protein GCM10010317_057930 [Streptomyces mirabilis]